MSLLPLLLTTGCAIVIAKITDAFKTKSSSDDMISDIVNVAVHRITWTKMVIRFKFKHTNSTNKQLTFKYIFLDVILGGVALGKIRETNINKPVAPNAVTEHTYDMDVSWLNLLLTASDDVVTALKGGQMPDKILITGYVKVNEYRSNYNKEYPLAKND